MASGNMRQARGQCGQSGASRGGKFCRNGINCRGCRCRPERQKPRFYWVFRDGTALADHSAWKVEPRVRHLLEFSPCCLHLALRRLRWTPSSR